MSVMAKASGPRESFTGWTDVDLSCRESRGASGPRDRARRIDTDIVYTSVLKRAIRTQG